MQKKAQATLLAIKGIVTEPKFLASLRHQAATGESNEKILSCDALNGDGRTLGRGNALSHCHHVIVLALHPEVPMERLLPDLASVLSNTMTDDGISFGFTAVGSPAEARLQAKFRVAMDTILAEIA